MDFLYFPENKAEYVPGFIWFGIGVVLAVIALYWLIRTSRRQEEKSKQLEEELLRKYSTPKLEDKKDVESNSGSKE